MGLATLHQQIKWQKFIQLSIVALDYYYGNLNYGHFNYGTGLLQDLSTSLIGKNKTGFLVTAIWLKLYNLCYGVKNDEQNHGL